MSDEWFVITHLSSGRVLDASVNKVKLQTRTDIPQQLWKLESADKGKVLFVNKANGEALQIKSGGVMGNSLVTKAKSGGSDQQWRVNSDDNTITWESYDETLVLNIQVEGDDTLTASANDRENNPKFQLQPQ